MTYASIRARLTLWYGGVLSLTLLGLGVAVYLLMARASLDRVDAMLDFEFREAAEHLATGQAARSLAEGPTAFQESYVLRVADASGRILAESGRLSGQVLPRVAESSDGPQSHASVQLGPIGLYRVVGGGVDTAAGRRLLQIATSLDAWGEELSQLRRVLWTILPVGLLAATLGGYWLAGFSLAPIGRMTATARRISAENLGERLVVRNPGDELGRLAATLNAMLDRIDRGFAASRQFTADAAHEFRTPVATIRSEAEVALLAPRTAEDYEQTLRSVVEEATRLGRLADRLLALSREDARAGCEPRPLRLDTLVHEAADDFHEAARRAGVRYVIRDVPAAAVLGDAVSLRQVLDNLLDNAVKYTPAGGEVAICGAVGEGNVTIEVSDTGIGIPPEALPRIFDRFFRVDPARSRRTGGAGLGLSIVRAVAERHGGTVEAESVPGVGSTFRVILPACSREAVVSTSLTGPNSLERTHRTDPAGASGDG